MIIFFAGDFFCAENDEFAFEDFSKSIGKENICILNFEGTMKISNNIKIKKKINLIQNKNILNKLPENIYLNLVNNHSTDLGIRNYFEMKEKINNINNLNRVKNRNLISIENTKILFFADKREDCNVKDTDFLEFDFKNILDISDSIKDSIVIIHGGLEGRIDPTPYQRYLSHLLIDLSAKTVIFMHSHVIGEVEIYKNKIIQYGLGNFYFSKIGKLHGHENDDSFLIGFDTIKGQINNYRYIKKDYMHTLKKENQNFVNYPDFTKYAHFYKKKYPLTNSLRPRQLEYNHYVVNIKFEIWNFFAKLLIKFGLSKKIKNMILLMTRKKY